MKTAIVIGRFQPITTAHYDIIQDAISDYDETYVVVINSPKSIVANTRRRMRASGHDVPQSGDVDSWANQATRDAVSSNELGDQYNRKLPKSMLSKNGGMTSGSIKKLQDEKNTNPFSGMTRKKLIVKSFQGKLHESHIITHNAANIQQIINKVHYMSKNTEFVLLCGGDRQAAYESQVKGGFDKGYFVPEVEDVQVKVLNRNMDSADNISATRVRNALKSGDTKTFASLTPNGIHSEFDNLRRLLMQEARMVPLFRKMLMEMIHIEDLKVGEFINFIRNIYDSEASVKLDGTAALSFGFDENGKFYTGFGRDFKVIKPELRRYSEEDWLKSKNIFINSAVSAHTFLEKNMTAIKKYIKPGETALAEILFGDKPNCIKYDFSGINYLVILNNEELADELNGKKMNIDTVNYVLETDTVVPKAVKQVWKIGKTQRVDPKKYEINIDEELHELEVFLNSETDGMRHIDIMGMRAVGKNKTLIKTVREKAQSFKLNIKERLLDQFVRKVREGDYIPSEGYSHEGIVLKLGNERAKIIDKEVFTFLHDRDWEPIHAAKKIKKSMEPEAAIAEIDKMITNFDTLYPNVADDMRGRMRNSLRMTKLFIKDKMNET